MSEGYQDPLETTFYTAKASGLPFLSDMGPMILAASYLGIASDTRSFARQLEQPHALVIREVSHLACDLELMTREDRAEKSSRVFYHLNDLGQALFQSEAHDGQA